MHRLLVWLAFLSLGSAPAFADQNGVSVSKPYSCGSDALSTLSFLCDGLKSIGVKACTVTGNSCTNASQELFSGLNIEFATPGNIKNWSGFGGTGEAYAIGALCLLKDLKDTPMTSKADARSDGRRHDRNDRRVHQFRSEDAETRRLAPGAGLCARGRVLRRLHPEIHVAERQDELGVFAGEGRAVSGPIDPRARSDGAGSGAGAGRRHPRHHGRDAIRHGQAKPHFGYAKAVGWVLAPYAANNLKSTWKDEIAPPALAAMAVDRRPHMLDLYGRIPGLKHSQIMPGPLPGQGSLVGQRYDPSHGWISQAGLGGRTIPEKGTTWKPPAGVEYPQRPDFAFDPEGPRSDIGKSAEPRDGRRRQARLRRDRTSCRRG